MGYLRRDLSMLDDAGEYFNIDRATVRTLCRYLTSYFVIVDSLRIVSLAYMHSNILESED